jgi:hypothetical protein
MRQTPGPTGRGASWRVTLLTSRRLPIAPCGLRLADALTAKSAPHPRAISVSASRTQ